MIHYIHHRINTIIQLESVPTDMGVELDIRYHNNDLVLHHDPFQHHTTAPTFFEDFLTHWHHKGPMILNVKTEGIEKDCMTLMQKYKVQNWFFLDLSMPYFAIYAQHAYTNTINGFSPDNLAVRFSEWEPIEYALAFSDKATWVWVDCFTHMPLNLVNTAQLIDAGFKICIVSPELQHHDRLLITDFKKKLESLHYDAVCTKHPNLWA